MPETILVTGATGKTGSALLGRLHADGINVIGASRHPAQPDHMRFEWQDAATHEAVLDDVGGIYLVAPTDTNAHLTIMQPFLERAVATGVRRFVLLSASILDHDSPMMGEVHKWLAANVPHWTVLRPSWFMQNFVTQHLPGIIEDDAIYSGTQDGRVPFIDVADIAAVAARALTDPAFPPGAAPVLTGPETLSYDAVADAISLIAGRRIRHVRLTRAAMMDRFTAFGIPSDFAAVLADLDDAIAQGIEDRLTGEVERLTGRAPRDLAAFLKTNGPLFQE